MQELITFNGNLLNPINKENYAQEMKLFQENVPQDCPPELVKLALDCTMYEPRMRPTMKGTEVVFADLTLNKIFLHDWKRCRDSCKSNNVNL